MILALAVIFLILVVLIGGDRGVRSLLALVMNIVVFFVDIIALKHGMNAYVMTLITIILMSITVLFFQNGYNLKTRATFLSILLVTFTVFIIAVIIAAFSQISGYNELNMYEDEASMLAGSVTINMTAAAIAMVIVGISGAVIDVAIAVSSAVYEVSHKNPHLDEKKLFASGMRMGGNILGTTINTLFFAGIGESLLLFLEMKELHYSLGQLINSKALFQMIFPILMSGIGCALIVPMSAWIMGTFVRKYQS